MRITVNQATQSSLVSTPGRGFTGILMDTYESVEALRCLVWADSRWHGPAMMSNGRDGLFEGILMYTYETVKALRCCIRLRIFISRLEMTLLHPYKIAEALCRRRNKISTAAEWQVV